MQQERALTRQQRRLEERRKLKGPLDTVDKGLSEVDMEVLRCMHEMYPEKITQKGSDLLKAYDLHKQRIAAINLPDGG